MSWLKDARTDCWSYLTVLPAQEYLSLVKEAHEEQGSIDGQRNVLTTTTAKRIRTRMVSDLRQGAVLPPIVIGVVCDDETFSSLPFTDNIDIVKFLSEHPDYKISIIDGMQRTAAIMEASSESLEVAGRNFRIEFWLANNVRAMIYRMLVLNTGQVPWTMNRQLSVVYSPLLEEIKAKVPELEKVSTPDRPGRRVDAAQYSSDQIIELYIAFSLRKTAVDTKEQVSDEFSRLDFVDNLANYDFQDQFYKTLQMLAKLDIAFSKFDSGAAGRFAKGRNIFDSQPARIGFIVAVGMHVLGRPGADRKNNDRIKRLESLQESHSNLLTKISGMDQDTLGDFLRLDVLSEVLDRRVGQVGRYERAVFGEAFKVLIEEEFSVSNMEICWRAN